MSIMFIVLGTIIVLLGILSIIKKWMWIQQGIIKRPVHVKKYMRYMGSVDIMFGLCWIAIGIIYYGSHIQDGIVLTSVLIYLLLKIGGEFKYHKKQAI